MISPKEICRYYHDAPQTVAGVVLAVSWAGNFTGRGSEFI